jgi:hypothetical protein
MYRISERAEDARVSVGVGDGYEVGCVVGCVVGDGELDGVVWFCESEPEVVPDVPPEPTVTPVASEGEPVGFALGVVDPWGVVAVDEPDVDGLG